MQNELLDPPEVSYSIEYQRVNDGRDTETFCLYVEDHPGSGRSFENVKPFPSTDALSNFLRELQIRKGWDTIVSVTQIVVHHTQIPWPPNEPPASHPTQSTPTSPLQEG